MATPSLEATMTMPLRVIQQVRPSIWMPLVFLALLVIGTYVVSTIRYHLVLRQYRAHPVSPHGQKALGVLPTLPLPYMLPFVGHSLGFLMSAPGAFWKRLGKALPAAAGGACRLMIAGRHDQHVLLTPASMAAVTNNRTLGRHLVSRDVAVYALGVEIRDANHSSLRTDKGRTPEEEIFGEHLLRADRTAELITTFTPELRSVLTNPAFNINGSEETSGSEVAREVSLCEWLWPQVFHASTLTIMGRDLLSMNPTLPADYEAFEEAFAELLWGLPRWLAPRAHRTRDKILASVEGWLASALVATSGEIPDPVKGPAWEPHLGSRVVRAFVRRQLDYGMTPHRMAPSSLGLLLAVNTNTVVATLWILMHLVDRTDQDQTLLPRVRAEVDSVPVAADGTPDVKRLTELPLLQSVYAEVLRLYVDIIILRYLETDLTLPIGHGGDGTPQVQLPKGGVLHVPTWSVHHDPAAWPGVVPPDEFDAERFLVPDEKGEMTFSLGSMPGRWAPYGGGKPMCPGRFFAKQEIFVTVATLLRMYDFEKVGYLDGKGKRTDKFPGVKSRLAGGGTLRPDGDHRVRMERRK
ncbi:hypothetical protein EPUS_01651 [Endocarpon pusillum Z07020]|uniref:Cytochrome P450 n=1 Tax=Endocarpon pusillum (strain Z07020 / HMAS-L-300199) TaxID=1263415 RepID=U1GUV0_ENDPU|nr:uncharacterized protein EPUS_01651 [Endocarpon pusillum Z07020]ERF75821.1 hypothetical protein EPUS_01651 [Endocarpon pusillum Z07020]